MTPGTDALDKMHPLAFTEGFQLYEKEISMPKPSLWRIKKAVHDYKRRLLKNQGENIRKVAVFGSVARNEHRAGSDIDIFVLIGKDDIYGHAKDTVVDMAMDLNIERSRNGIYISPLVLTQKEYDECRGSTLVLFAIRDEGVVLYDAEQ
jgi:predicted nucleotidyltransferase